MGGVNAAGRTSFHQGFRRIVIDKLTAEARQETFVGLATLMNILTYQEGQLVDGEGNSVALSEVENRFGQQILDGTLIRKIENNHFDPDATHCHTKITVSQSKLRPRVKSESESSHHISIDYDIGRTYLQESIGRFETHAHSKHFLRARVLILRNNHAVGNK